MTERNIEPIARAVCAALGATLKHNKENNWYACAVMPDGVTVGLCVGFGKNARLDVSVNLPNSNGSTQTPRDLITHDETKAGTFTTRISMDAAKPAAKIAADITRRLLPSAITLHARAVERAQSAEKWAAGRQLTLATLAQRLGVEPRHRFQLYPGGLSLEVAGPDRVTIDRIYCTAETAAKVVELLRAEKPDDNDA